jgi:thiol-disulfide isomerase/thioredoxin
MRRPPVFLLVLGLGLLLLACGPGHTQVSGLVADSAGKPPLKAQVEVFTPDRPETPQVFDVSPGGSFEIAPAQTGVIRLNFIAAFHESNGVSLLILKPEKIRLDVRLRTYDWVEDFTAVQVIGDFNGFSRNSGAVALHQLSDGTFFADVDNPRDGSLGYRLIGLVKNSPLSMPGTYLDELIRDDNGRYVSVIKAPRGRVRILFDPARLPREQQKPEIIVGPPDSQTAKVAAIDKEITRHQRDYYLALSAFRAAGHDEKDFQYDWSDAVASWKGRLDKEKDEPVRQALLIGLLDLGKLGSSEVDRGTAQKALAEIPADSPLWELAPWYLLFDTIHLAGGMEQYAAYFDKAVTTNPSRTVKALTLEQAYNEALVHKDSGRAKEYYRRLTGEFGDLLAGQRVKSRPPESKFVAGQAMPAFNFDSLDDPRLKLTNETFKGKAYLIDFWATWCAPCVAEMDSLHKLRAKYKSRGLEVLSVSFDQTPEDIRQFRQKKWKMPWLHAFIGMNEFRVGSKVCDYFELSEIPRAILVDREGKVAAVGEEALGEKLAANVARILR